MTSARVATAAGGWCERAIAFFAPNLPRTTLQRLAAATVAIALVAIAYAAAGSFGVWLLHRILEPTLATMAPTLGVPWLAVGVGVAGVLLFGRRALPGVFIGSYFTWGVAQNDPWMPVLLDATGETASIALIVALLRTWDYRVSLARYQDALILVAAAALGRLLSASIDVVATFAAAWFMSTPETRSALEEAGVFRDGNVFVVHPTLFTATFRWWANSVAGVVLVVPLLAAVVGDDRPGTRALGERVLWVVAALAWLTIAFLLPGLLPRIVLLAAALVLVVWAALRFGVALASAGTLAFASAATIGFGLQLGAFAGIGGREAVEVVWGFIGLLAGTGLFLTPLLAGRARAQHRLGASVERYRRLFLANPSPMWVEEIRSGRILVVNDAAIRTYGYSEQAFTRLHSRDLRAGGAATTDDLASRAAGGAYESTHRTASGAELDVEVTPVEIALDAAVLRVCFVDLVRERNDLRLAVLSAADLERHRLGQEIREGLGRVLARLAARVEELVVATACNEPIPPALASATENDAVAASAMCRQLTRGASPIQFASGNLLEALQRMPDILVAGPGPEVTVSVRSLAPVRLSVERAEHVYRIAHEAVRAALVRPGTGRVYVAIDVDAHKVAVTVEDDGIATIPGPQQRGSEVWPMDVRAAAARAQLDVAAREGGGTRVYFECSQAREERQPVRPAPIPGSGDVAAHGAAHAAAPPHAAEAVTGSRAWLDGALLFGAYFATGALGLRFLQEIDSRHISLLPAVAVPWIASGVAVAGLLLRGKRLAPAVFLATIALWRGLAHDPWITVIADACGETLAALLAAYLLEHWGFRRAFDRFRDFAVLIAAAIAARSVSTAFDVIGLHTAAVLAPQTLTPELLEGLASTGDRLFGLTYVELRGYLRWWLNGVGGVTLAVPVLAATSVDFGRVLQRRWREATVFVGALTVAALAIGGGPTANWRLPVLGLGVVMVAWAALRFGVALAAAAALALSLAATFGYGLGLGPVATAAPGEGPEVLWGFIGMLGATGLFLTTVVAEHESTMRGLKGLKARYEALFEAIPRPLFAYSESTGAITMVNAAATRRYGYTRAEFLALTAAALGADAPPAHEASPGGEQRVLARAHRDRSGESFDVELSLTPVDLGDDIEQLCFAIDVTERNALRRRVLETSDLERRRLAQELHDSLGQSLTGLHLGLASVRRTVEQSGSAKSEAVLFASSAIRDAMQSCEQIIHGLSPLQATDGDLVAALERMPAQSPPAVRAKLVIEVHADSALKLALPMREHLYQIAREAVNNAVKHADANRIGVTLAVAPTEITLLVEDDGSGFDVPSAREHGFGLQSLALRTMALRGRLSIEPRARGGTRVTCRCPQGAA
jgi:PAS domain S-box-containing protein